MRWIPGLVLLAAMFGACGDSAPCDSCPTVAGSYAVTWNLDAGRALEVDGGTSSPVNANCPGPRDGTWVVNQRSAAQITTTVGGTIIGGTYYDTYDVLLTGSDNGVTYQLRATAIPTGGTLDGGMTLSGTLGVTTVPTSGTPCTSTESFTAQRLSR